MNREQVRVGILPGLKAWPTRTCSFTFTYMSLDLIENDVTWRHRLEGVAHGCNLLSKSKRGPNFRTYLLPCYHVQDVHPGNMRAGKFKCRTCSLEKLHLEAAAQDCKLLSKSEKGRLCRTYQLPCGHTQDVHTNAMRIGNFKCRICSIEKLHLEATAQDCKLLSKSKRGCLCRTYQLPCGHTQDVHTNAMRAGHFRCRTCYPMKTKERATTEDSSAVENRND